MVLIAISLLIGWLAALKKLTWILCFVDDAIYSYTIVDVITFKNQVSCSLL